MTITERLTEAGWQRARHSRGECGEALRASGADLNGLACRLPALWTEPSGTGPARCARHAADHL